MRCTLSTNNVSGSGNPRTDVATRDPNQKCPYPSSPIRYGAASETVIVCSTCALVSHIFDLIAINADRVNARSPPSHHDS